MQMQEDEEILNDLVSTVVKSGYDKLTENQVTINWNKKKLLLQKEITRFVVKSLLDNYLQLKAWINKCDFGEEYVKIYTEVFKVEIDILDKCFRNKYSYDIKQNMRIIGQSTVYTLKAYIDIHAEYEIKHFTEKLIRKQIDDFENVANSLAYILGVSGKKFNLTGLQNYY